MPIEIRELVISVKVEESAPHADEAMDLHKVKQAILKECKRTIKKELNKRRER